MLEELRFETRFSSGTTAAVMKSMVGAQLERIERVRVTAVLEINKDHHRSYPTSNQQIITVESQVEARKSSVNITTKNAGLHRCVDHDLTFFADFKKSHHAVFSTYV
jgi:hypothetical protein